MLIPQSRLSKMFALALLSATLVAAAPTQTSIYAEKIKPTLNAGLTLTKVAAVFYFLNQSRFALRTIIFLSPQQPFEGRRMCKNQGAINLALAAMTTKSLCDDVQTFMKNRPSRNKKTISEIKKTIS